MPASNSISRDFSETINELDLLTGVNDHLQFAEAIINREDIHEFTRKELFQQVANIKKRLSDPNLKLAIIGEFSSGKSTFINALLRNELLMTSAKVATASATYLRHSDGIEVEVKFKSDRLGVLRTRKIKSSFRKYKTEKTSPIQKWIFHQIKHFTETSKSRLMRFILRLLIKLIDCDYRKFIHLVTSEDTIAKDVLCVNLTHPSEFLANNIIIIDTPGTNAVNAHHGAVTTRIVEKESDTILVIIPANTPLSQTLSDFLEGPIQSYLHRCLFVVTKIDQIRKKEQADLLKDLRTRISNRLSIENARLYPCSAQVVLDDLYGEPDIPNNILVWKEEFFKLEKIILEHLKSERFFCIAESLLRLLSSLFEQLDNNLKDKWQKYEEQQQAIKREIIPDLRLFMTQQSQICQQMLHESLSASRVKIDKIFMDFKSSAESKIRSAIFDSKKIKDLKKAVKKDIQAILDEKACQLEREVQVELGLFEQSGLEAGKHFDAKFTEVYQKLEALEAMKVMTPSKTNKKDKISRENAVRVSETAKAQNGKFFPRFLFGPSLDKRKQELWGKLSPELNAYFEQLRGRCNEDLSVQHQKMLADINQRIELYGKRYQGIVDHILKQQQEKKRNLDGLQRKIQSDLQEIDRRRNTLISQQQRLSSPQVLY